MKYVIAKVRVYLKSSSRVCVGRRGTNPRGDPDRQLGRLIQGCVAKGKDAEGMYEPKAASFHSIFPPVSPALFPTLPLRQ